MGPSLVLAGFVLGPVAILNFLRVNAALAFLSLCLGEILVEFTANDASSYLSTHAGQLPAFATNASSNTVKLVLLLLPVVITTILMMRTIHGRNQQVINAIPSLGVGLLGAILVTPLLPSGFSHDIFNSSLWHFGVKIEDLIVGASAIACLVVLWLHRPKGHSGKKKHS